jgi:hypothetical protein
VSEPSFESSPSEDGTVNVGAGSAVIEATAALGPAASAVVLRSAVFGARLGDENGFLLATPPGPAGRGVVGDLPIRFDDFDVGVLLVDNEFCRMNSQLSARITKIRTLESTS